MRSERPLHPALERAVPRRIRLSFERARGDVGLWLKVLFAATTIFGAWMLVQPWLREHRPSYGYHGYYQPLAHSSTTGDSREILLLALLWGLALYAWWRGSRVPLRWLLAGAAFLHLLVLFAPPPQSQDLWQYLFYGRMQVALHPGPHAQAASLPGWFLGGHANPYVASPSNFWTDAWYSPSIHWPNQPSVYGPVWSMLSAAVALASAGSLLRAFFVYKLVVLGFDAVLAWLVVTLARDGVAPGPDTPGGDATARMGWALLAYAWNPLVLIVVPLGGLVDAAVAAMVLGAVLAHRRGRPGIATLLLTLATLVKLYAAVPLGLYLVLRLRERGVRVAAGHALLALALSVAAFVPYWAGPQVLRGLLNVAGLTNFALAGVVQRLVAATLSLAGVATAQTVAGDIVRGAALLALLLTVAWALRTARTAATTWYAALATLLVASLVSPWFLYWYLLTPIALICILPRNRLTVPGLVLAGTAVFTPTFSPYPAALALQTVGRYGPALLAWWRRWGARAVIGAPKESPPSETSEPQEPEGTAGPLPEDAAPEPVAPPA